MLVKLVDLGNDLGNNSVARIEYTLGIKYPSIKDENDYWNLIRQKSFCRLSEQDERQLNNLSAMEGEQFCKIELIQIFTYNVSNVFSITGYQFELINDAINKINEPLLGVKIRISEYQTDN